MTTPERPDPSAIDQEGRLANRATLLTLVALCSFLVALIAMPLTFQRTEEVGPRVASGAPLALGVGAILWARSARVQLAAHRDEQGPAQS